MELEENGHVLGLVWHVECVMILHFGGCGFAQSQEAYNTAVNELFSTLEMLDDHLGSFRYLCGGALTLADICLFTTFIRFDLVYNVLFKCTKKKLLEYPNLHAYMRDIYQVLTIA
jgi:putative glutathione S-transferase